MVPVYHCPYEEGVLVLLCVVGRQLETSSISDFVAIDNVCGLKVLILGGSYPSAASTVWGQVVFGGYGLDGCFVSVILLFALGFCCFLGGGFVFLTHF